MFFLGNKVKIIGVALLFVAFSSGALTLGRVRGAALVGQSLDMVVPVQMDAGEDASTLCFEADVFHADTRQDSSRVRVLVEASSQPNSANVRVLSSSLIDEPVVTIYLRTGCGQKTTRRYVLLADMPSEIAVPSTPRVTPVPVPVIPYVATSATANSVPPVATVKSKSARAAKAKAQPVADDTVPSVAKVATARPISERTRPQAKVKSKPERPAGQSRLKLDPLELLSDRVANLDSFMTFEPTEDAVRSMQRIQTLESLVKAGQITAAKNEASLADLKKQLQVAESDRTPDGLLYGLIGLVLACLAAVAYLWHRQRHMQGGVEWWSAAGGESDLFELPPDPAPPPASEKASHPAVAPQALERIVVAEPAMSELSQLSAASANVDVNLTEMSESTFGDFMLSGDKRGHNRQSSQSVPLPPLPMVTLDFQPKPASSFNSEAVVDARQQADFFVSLGQTDRAVRILKKKIEESEEPNPFYFLDVLDLVHTLGLKTEFQKFREDFNLFFTGLVPEFVFFKNEGHSLESYPDVVSRISALWPTREVLPEIEACIFKDPRAGKDQSFDLAAFRDLLLLHSIAQSIVISNEPEDSEYRRALQQETLPQQAHKFDLDLDLSDDFHVNAAAPAEIPQNMTPNFGSDNMLDFDDAMASQISKFSK